MLAAPLSPPLCPVSACYDGRELSVEGHRDEFKSGREQRDRVKDVGAECLDA